MNITVVIPTFNRGPLLAQTVEHLLRSRLDGVSEVEIILVDDGSTVAAKDHVAATPVPPPFTLRVIRQANTGPGGARNTGFRAARGSLVIFMDDDVLAGPELVSKHLDAHRRFPGSVVFGPCALAAEPDTPLRRFLNRLHAPAGDEPFTRAGIVASGHLSVERVQFDTQRAVYRDDLRIPCAEEFELSYRLRTSGVPVIMFASVVATHLQPVALGPVRMQQRKYGMGIAEASLKYPQLVSMPEFAALLAANSPPAASDSIQVVTRKLMKEVARRRPFDPLAEAVLRLLEQLGPRSRALDVGYRALLGTSLYAGLQDGLRQFRARS